MILRDRRVVLAGRFSTGNQKELKTLLESQGARVLRSLDTETDLLIAGARSDKQQAQARELEVEIWSESEMLTHLKKQEETPTKKAVSPTTSAVSGPWERSFADPRFWHDGEVHEILGIEGNVVTYASGALHLWDTEGTLLHKLAVKGGDYEAKVFISSDNPARFVVRYEETWTQYHFGIFEVSDQQIHQLYERSYESPRDHSYYNDVLLQGDTISIGFSCFVERWNWKTDECLFRFDNPLNQGAENGVAFHPDGELVGFVSYEKKNATTLSLPDGKQGKTFKPTEVHNAYGPVFGFVPGTTDLLFTCNQNYEVRLERWDTTKGKKRDSYLCCYGNNTPMELQFLPRTTTVLLRVNGIKILAYDLEQQNLNWSINKVYYPAEMGVMEDTLLVTRGHRIQVFDLATGEETSSYQGVFKPAEALHYDVATSTLLAISDNQSYTLNLENGSWEEGIPARELVRSPDGQTYVFSNVGWMQEVSGINFQEGWFRPLFSGHFSECSASARYFLTGDSYGAQVKRKSLRVWDLQGNQRVELKGGVPDTYALLGDGETIVAGKGTSLLYFSMTEAQKVDTLKKVQKGGIRRIVVAPDTRTFASISENEILFWTKGEETPHHRQSLKKRDLVDLWCLEAPHQWLACDNHGAFFVIDTNKDGEWQEVHRFDSPFTAAHLRSDGMLYLARQGELVESPALLSTSLTFPPLPMTEASKPTFVDWESTSSKNLQKMLQQADWTAFSAEEDGEALRSHLSTLEEKKGVTELHHFAAQKLLEKEGEVLHRAGHFEELVSVAMSPDGQYFATGNWVGGDYHRGGVMQIWEVATGRCVNIFDPVQGGVGWPGYAHCIKWSPDGKQIGLAYNTNTVGNFLPFDRNPWALTSLSVTDGWSRPPAWTWSPDGKQMMVSCWGDSKIPGCIAPLNKGSRYDDGVQWFSQTFPEEHLNEEGEPVHIEPARTVYWSRDGKRIYGHNTHSQMYSVNVETRELEFLQPYGSPIAWSPDNTLVAECREGLFLRCTRTQNMEPLFDLSKEFQSPRGLFWSPCSKWLAIEDEGGTIHLWNDSKIVSTLETDSEAPGDTWDWLDGSALAWSMDSTLLASLRETAVVEIWEVGESPHKQREFKVSSDALSLHFGVNNRLLVVGKTGVEFWDANTGKKYEEFSLQEAMSSRSELVPDVPSPLELKGEDFGESFSIHPCFATSVDDEAEWVVAFTNGVVLCPESHTAALDRELSLVVERKLAFPWRWLGLPTYSSLKEAEDKGAMIPLPEATLAKLRKKKAPKKKPPTLPLGKKGSLESLFKVHWGSVKDLRSGWDSHVSDHQREIAGWHAEDGDVEPALEAASRVPEVYTRIATYGDVAAYLFHSGQEKAAKEAFQIAEELLAANKMKQWSFSYIYPPLAAAAGLLGETEKSEQYFKLSRKKIKDESNQFQKYWHVARGYFLMKDWEGGIKVFDTAPWKHSIGWSNSYYQEAIIYLLLRHEDVMAQKMIDLAEKREMEISHYELDTIREIAAGTRDMEIATPEQLKEQFLEVRKQRVASRNYHDLCMECAKAGEYAAAKKLLLEIPSEDLNDRPSTAIRVLRYLKTGRTDFPSM